ncbi:MAG: glycosyltransferase, partial [Nocardioides sp.]
MRGEGAGGVRRVVAVVVTFNRLDLLRRLLGELRDIDGVAEILVIDNASTDGTGAWLRDQEADGPTIRARTLPTNTGGAGGFHTGVEWAMRRDADLIWLMDDDGRPEASCLDTLLSHDGRYDFWGP